LLGIGTPREIAFWGGGVRALFGNEEGRSLFVSWKVVIDPQSRMSLLPKQSKIKVCIEKGESNNAANNAI
jgi:hypothetical protein